MSYLAIPKDIETKRLRLNRLTQQDAEEIFFGYASKEVATRYVSWPTHQSIEDTRNFLRMTQRGWWSGREYSFSIRDREYFRLVGSFGIINDDGNVQFGYIFNPSQWGKGFATEVCRRMMAILGSLPPVRRIWTLVDNENLASRRVLEKSGLVEDENLRRKIPFINQGNRVKDCLVYRFPLPGDHLLADRLSGRQSIRLQGGQPRPADR